MQRSGASCDLHREVDRIEEDGIPAQHEGSIAALPPRIGNCGRPPVMFPASIDRCMGYGIRKVGPAIRVFCESDLSPTMSWCAAADGVVVLLHHARDVPGACATRWTHPPGGHRETYRRSNVWRKSTQQRNMRVGGLPLLVRGFRVVAARIPGAFAMESEALANPTDVEARGRAKWFHRSIGAQQAQSVAACSRLHSPPSQLS